jgi:hypothetical protein
MSRVYQIKIRKDGNYHYLYTIDKKTFYDTYEDCKLGTNPNTTLDAEKIQNALIKFKSQRP